MIRKVSDRPDIESRNRTILVLFCEQKIHRKQIALMMQMRYDAVKKVLQKYQGPDRRKIVRPIQSYDEVLHSHRQTRR